MSSSRKRALSDLTVEQKCLPINTADDQPVIKGARTPKKKPKKSLLSPRLCKLADLTSRLLGAKHVYSDELLKLLLRSTRASRETQVGLPSGASDFQEDLIEGYEGMGYACMDTDVWRNEYYRASIARISSGHRGRSDGVCTGKGGSETSSKNILSIATSATAGRSPRHTPKPRGLPTSTPLNEWFEIGPGAKGTLSRMVLEEHPSNSLFAIEAIPSSAAKVAALLKEYGSRFRVVEGLAGQVPFPAIKPPTALVCELLGHFGTSEGYIAVLHACKKAYPKLVKSLQAAVPLYFGTNVVPVDLSTAEYIRVAAFEEKLVLVDRFPFAVTQLVSPSEHGVMELYNTLEVLRGKVQKEYEFLSSWLISGQASSRPFHGLCFYLIFGDAPSEAWHTANVDLGHSSTNWCNVFVPLGKGTWMVENGDKIQCLSRCSVGTLQPSYTYHVTVSRAGQICHDETASIDYYHLIPRVDTLSNWDKRARQSS